MLGITNLEALVKQSLDEQVNDLPRINPNAQALKITGFDAKAVILDAILVFLFIAEVYPLVLKNLQKIALLLVSGSLAFYGYSFLQNNLPVNSTLPASPNTSLPTIQATIVVAATNHFQRPIPGYISQHFSWIHQALDIPGPIGEPIKPVAAGTVLSTAYEPAGYGFTVVIKHKDGFTSRYAHLSRILVKAGDEVNEKTFIGLVGVSGRVTGPHLHLEIYRYGINVDPEKFLPSY